MTVFESSITINQPASAIYAFLTDLNNHQGLMPDSISDWSSSTKEARFTIQNMLKLTLKLGDCVQNSQINIIPAEKPPFDLLQTWNLQPLDANQTAVSLTTSAELNMMMKMMASGPLQKLVDYETASLHQQFS
jgi:ribosome-associated toxin RatA of RatAB toxin-antitoxin module